MNVVIGDHLEVDALARQEIGDVAVGRDPVEAGARGAGIHEMDLVDPLVDQGRRMVDITTPLPSEWKL